MLGTDGTGHQDHSIDELCSCAGRHRFVASVKRGMVETLPFDERGKGIDEGGSTGHVGLLRL
jgi:hypothetical protein